MAYFVVYFHCQGQLWLLALITLLIFNSDSESLFRSAIPVQCSGRSLSSSCRKKNDETLSEKNLPKTTAVVLRSSRSASQSILIAFLSNLVFVSTVSLISTPFSAAAAIFFRYFFESSICEDSIGFPLSIGEYWCRFLAFCGRMENRWLLMRIRCLIALIYDCSLRYRLYLRWRAWDFCFRYVDLRFWLK